MNIKCVIYHLHFCTQNKVLPCFHRVEVIVKTHNYMQSLVRNMMKHKIYLRQAVFWIQVFNSFRTKY